MQAERLLRDMTKVCCHDLPNQIVVAQTLLQLLFEDEAERLSENGCEYLRRAKSVLERAGGLARFLREMAKLASAEPNPASVECATLSRDWRLKLAERCPAANVNWQFTWHVSNVHTDSRLLTSALVEILALFVKTETNCVTINMRSEMRSDGIALVLVLGGVSPLPRKEWEGRIEWILARNWLTAAGADLDEAAAHADSVAFVILLAR